MHCISDWGHDFRPDYRRLVRILDLMPRGVPVLCTTATANDRVVDDIVDQLDNLIGAKLAPTALAFARPHRRSDLSWSSLVDQATGLSRKRTARDCIEGSLIRSGERRRQARCR